MELKDLVGKHFLSGVDYSLIKSTEEYGEDCNCIDFILDDVVYSAIEDPGDGYRSYMEDLEINRKDANVANKFKSVEVYIIKRCNNDYKNNDIIDIYDVITNKIVLSIGTDNIDDYYPCYIGEWSPENLSLNITEKEL
jgi:hypothetical protein